MTTLERIKKLCYENGITIAKLERELGFSNGSIAKAKALKAERISAIAAYFKLPVEFFFPETLAKYSNSPQAEQYKIKEKAEPMQTSGFYLDQDVLNLMQLMSDEPQYKTLFKAAASVKKEDIEKAKAVLDVFKKDDYAE